MTHAFDIKRGETSVFSSKNNSSYGIILTRKLVALLLLSFGCFITVNVLWLILMVQWVGLQCVIMVFPDHTQF